MGRVLPWWPLDCCVASAFRGDMLGNGMLGNDGREAGKPVRAEGRWSCISYPVALVHGAGRLLARRLRTDGQWRVLNAVLGVLLLAA